jgi:predicted Zn-dependent protease
MLVGDGSALTEFLASLGIQAVQSSYSRDDERAADQFALELLNAAGADPSKLADMFERLEKVQEKEGAIKLGGLGAFLSTHHALR